MKKNDAFRRAAALMAALSITVSLAAPAFAGTYYIDYGDITITKMDDGSQKIEQNGKQVGMDAAGDETIITTVAAATTTQESDLEDPATEDSGVSPVVEDNYQTAPPAQPEDNYQTAPPAQPEDNYQTAPPAQPEDNYQTAPPAQPEDNYQTAPPAQPEDNYQTAPPAQPEDNYQTAPPAQPEDAEQLEDAEELEDDEQQPQPQQAAPTSVNEKFWKYTITVINDFADKVLNLTLKDVKIDVSDTGTWGITGKAALSVQGEGNVEIELDGDNELKSGYYRAGLEKNSTGTLTLKDDNKEAGSLTATGGDSGAGIGGGYGRNGEDITITGGGYEANSEDIIITGGTVNAHGGSFGAGIGGGYEGNGEDIIITGGTVNATGGYRGAGIGGGAWGSGHDITINDGTVNAAGDKDGGAGIGGGYEGNGEDIIINDGSVTAAGGYEGAGIGGGKEGNGKNITINGGTVNATGGKDGGAGIGGGYYGSGKKITITGGSVTATGGKWGAGIGGGAKGSGSNVTVSGAAQVTAKAGKRNGQYGAGATIGYGGNKTGGQPVDGDELQADISGLMTTGYIHHILYEQDGTTIKREWWEFGHLQPTPDGESLDLHVETLEGDPLPFNARQQGSTLRVTTDNLAARLHGTRQALEALREQGVEQIQFVTTLKTTTLSVEDLLAEGGSWFALEHNGLVSRQLSAAQAESLKCWMH